jgi:hypothetical protein
MPGFDSTALAINAIMKRVESLVTRDNVLFNVFPSLFEVVNQRSGTKHTWGIRYNYTSNATAMSSFVDAAPLPDTTAEVQAEVNKTPYQATILTYDVLKAMMDGEGRAIDEGAIGLAVGNLEEVTEAAEGLRNVVNSTAIASLEAQIDSSGNVYSNNLSRATYGLASKEVDASGATLSLDMLDECVEYVSTTAGGNASRDDLVWLAGPKQVRALGKISSATVGVDITSSNLPLISSAQDLRPIDAGRTFRTTQYDNIPIIPVNSMANSNVLLCRKSTIKLIPWAGLTVESKEQAILALQKALIIWLGYDLICKNPAKNCKISGLG